MIFPYAFRSRRPEARRCRPSSAPGPCCTSVSGGFHGALSFIASVAGRGGAFTAADFAAASVEWVEPLRLGYRGVDVRVLPPNSYGLYLLLQLRLLDQAAPQWDDIDDAERLRTLIGAAQKAFPAADRRGAGPAA